MDHRLTVDLAQQVLTMVLANRKPMAGLLHHTDRGSQYAATRYQQFFTTHGMTPSMSRTGNCWDNACVESFSGTLKRKFVCHRHYAIREEAAQDIFEYIEVFCNRRRRHSTSVKTPRPSLRRGRLWRNRVSKELGERNAILNRDRCQARTISLDEKAGGE